MTQKSTRSLRAALTTIATGAVLAAPLVGVASSAQASVDGTGVVINEAYLKGGSAGAPFSSKFVELYNPGTSAVSLDGWSLQYRSAGGEGAVNGVGLLSGSIAAGGYFLVAVQGNGATGSALPAPDLDLGSAITPSGTNGTLILADVAEPLAPAPGSVTETDGIVDLVGYGSSNTFETLAATVDGGNSVPNSLARTGFADTDDNSADFVSTGTVTPQNAAGTGPVEPEEPEEPGEPTEHTIAELQGTGDASPFATPEKPPVTTTGVVTAAYPTGGFKGYYIQTPGTGGAIDLATHTASDAIFVYSESTVGSVAVGDLVKVTGHIEEFNGLTEFVVGSADGLEKLLDAADPVVPATIELPREEAQRESLEGMLLAPQGQFTVSNTYSTNQYAEIGLASGSTPLITPTEIARPGTPEYTAAVAENAARAVTLDDGASINFLGSAENQALPLPYLTDDRSITVGSAVSFTSPVIFDYRNNTWKFQPTTQLVAGGTLPATFSDVQPQAPEEVGGDIVIAGFNVLNYFTTTGDQLTGCTFYTDRDGNNVTVDEGCDARGAAEADDLERQQAKIVAAINGLGADVVSLEEIENSVKFGKDRDEALSTLVDALNEGLAPAEQWEFVPSPAADQLPTLAAQDVIRTAFIYKEAAVEPVGTSRVLLDDAFSNARQPLAQEFIPAGGSDDDAFIAIVNHFKSKGSGSGADADQGDGQGGSNASRVAQASALVEFSASLQSELGTDEVFLIGDFNAYSQEDPVKVITDAGYVDQGGKTGEYSYSFSGQSGSLDHIFASAAADAKVTGVDIWNINSGESIAKEYSRFNYNATDFYDESVFRSSDHDPVIVGYSVGDEPVEPVTDRVAGADRYATSVEASLEGFPEGAETVYVVSGEVFPDALSASPAAARADAPILLTQQGQLPPGVAAEVERLDPESIVVVGGVNSVSAAVQTALGQIAPVSRIQGADRYETSRLVAESAFPEGAAQAVVAAGANFADALSAGAAIDGAGPVVLVDGRANSLDAASAALIEELGLDEIAVAGGEKSVSAGIVTQLGTIAETVRLGGVDRYESSRLINAHFFTSADRVVLATGVGFPDALSGSGLAPKLDAPLFTVPGDCVPAETLAQIDALGAGQVTLLGGENTLSPAVAELTACAAG
ncbi:ExeM/NucH family extracellular endonuclease [Herbiconiux sp. KACC 21604]|uniref:ExeM/NucH family extracellular endonuclease n=1 Tax=unclassified Herbiconiux TaxID=2618217 RepID=UPI001492DB0D|nr:ExeM/NucH family extracellular endonuclease [Herbiconiux sp. SALV-R1]QJU54968.1 ExeM/NucH family extracellular endonuclease [Herbiconiux sp. SALV-R1]WPO86094.1 ExeM/NucH family extracellular endonuclease [Herbiconiux sp. KACC 21604]